MGNTESNIDIIKITRGDDLRAIVLSKNKGKRLAEIHYHEGVGFWFEQKENIVWMLSELEEIINFCKDENIKIPKVPESDLFVLMEGSKH